MKDRWMQDWRMQDSRMQQDSQKGRTEGCRTEGCRTGGCRTEGCICRRMQEDRRMQQDSLKEVGQKDAGQNSTEVCIRTARRMQEDMTQGCRRTEVYVGEDRRLCPHCLLISLAVALAKILFFILAPFLRKRRTFCLLYWLTHFPHNRHSRWKASWPVLREHPQVQQPAQVRNQNRYMLVHPSQMVEGPFFQKMYNIKVSI